MGRKSGNAVAVQAMRAVVAQADALVTVDQVAARFSRTCPECMRPLLDMLTALALVN